jgi:hypothetical protein
MQHVRTLTVASTHHLFGHLRAAAERSGCRASDDERDSGAVSLEQVLWFVAAGVSVAVIASILWTQIKNEAQKPVDAPVQP